MSIYESGQMYLETIYILSQKKSHVRAIDVGEQMGYSKPSVSRALSILKRDDYVSVDDTGGISLTAKGMEVAKTMYTRHTVLSRLTGDVLGYFSRYSSLLAGSKWRRFSIVSTAFRRRNAKTIPRADYTTVR